MNEPATGLFKVPPFITLEAWRGLAALWVVGLHACLTRLVDIGPRLTESSLNVLLLQGQLGVTIFFVVSGYCIANAAISARSRSRPLFYFLKARVRRIYPPYYFSILLWIGVSLLVASLSRRGFHSSNQLSQLSFFHQSPLYYLANLTLTQMFFRQDVLIIIFWSLCYEIAFYGVVAIALYSTLRARNANSLLYLLDALTIAVLVWLNLMPTTCPFPLHLWHQFGLGVLVYHRAAAPGKRGPCILLALSVALMISFATFHGGIAKGIAHPSPRAQTYFCLTFGLLLIASQPCDLLISRLKIVRLLAWVGTFSYSLYLTHLVVVTGLAQVGRHFPVPFVRAPALLIVLQVVVSVAFARLFFWYCERPFMGRAAIVNSVMSDPIEFESASRTKVETGLHK